MVSKIKSNNRETQADGSIASTILPNLAPAELVFALTKRKLLFKKESNEINFGRNSGKISIIESLRAVDSLWCRKNMGQNMTGVFICDDKSVRE